ncbi:MULTISPECIES: methyl-accepting chemotaxis protein [Clostridium]|uniref:Methyl-accepting chemotaxis sensory transducer with Cache sensor n=1 Tax=Clostridium carnis TaxID=1530 RepID=A0ABY6SNI3_9CLOT|nr:MULTISPECIES: methyl-accepting chemotaxis protein [Clostridium]CAI3544037.1 Conserved hypothetical protein, MCP signaling domain [Clostridium neonatale]CAI3570185.1 Conserved hypothetical protein, MCP signaling domain [Clostridium neonatale]CAI3660340.1 Conserved hypothetical protein, MCP signaling domain [Clostridium neonatale]CAI3693130.1 Conserved hypothetical protein, MCP signaling domain [Clostridium neonatale]CAI3694093.1 Conserved hypothetical protein, MCP signaling domain [Clostridi
MLQNFKIKTKIIGMASLLVVGILITSIVGIYQERKLSTDSLNSLEKAMRSDYDDEIKNQVGAAISVINEIYKDYQNGEYTEDEAKLLAADLVREMRYGENGYFWIDTYEGDNVVLLGSDTEGTNRINTEDANGYKMVADIIKNGKNGGGYTDYYFPKEGETKASPKRSYSQAFEPFKWVIGTGNYTDDIDKSVNEDKKELSNIVTDNIGEFFIIVVVAILASIVLTIIISKEILNGFKSIIKSLEIMATGNFKEEIPEKLLNRKDDFGIIAKSLENMHSAIRNLIYEAKNAANGNNAMAEKIGENISVLNEDIESVSAVTEELAAGMEECAASSEEMSASTHEINAASASIAKKSEEGATQAIEITKRAKTTKKKATESKSRADKLGNEIQYKLEEALKSAKVVDKIKVLADVILSITEQTNLLALNAAIEAARAGEAGKGFSVVAEEIRKLAEQSKEAVENIQIVTKEVTDAVTSLSDNSNMLLNFVKEDVTKDYDKFIIIANEYENDATFVESLITDFSATAEELTASLDNVLSAIDEVAKTASEGAQGTTDIAQKSTDIHDKSELVLSNVRESIEYSNIIKNEMDKFII